MLVTVGKPSKAKFRNRAEGSEENQRKPIKQPFFHQEKIDPYSPIANIEVLRKELELSLNQIIDIFGQIDSGNESVDLQNLGLKEKAKIALAYLHEVEEKVPLHAIEKTELSNFISGVLTFEEYSFGETFLQHKDEAVPRYFLNTFPDQLWNFLEKMNNAGIIDRYEQAVLNEIPLLPVQTLSPLELQRIKDEQNKKEERMANNSTKSIPNGLVREPETSLVKPSITHCGDKIFGIGEIIKSSRENDLYINSIELPVSVDGTHLRTNIELKEVEIKKFNGDFNELGKRKDTEEDISIPIDGYFQNKNNPITLLTKLGLSTSAICLLNQDGEVVNNLNLVVKKDCFGITKLYNVPQDAAAVLYRLSPYEIKELENIPEEMRTSFSVKEEQNNLDEEINNTKSTEAKIAFCKEKQRELRTIYSDNNDLEAIYASTPNYYQALKDIKAGHCVHLSDLLGNEFRKAGIPTVKVSGNTLVLEGSRMRFRGDMGHSKNLCLEKGKPYQVGGRPVTVEATTLIGGSLALDEKLLKRDSRQIVEDLKVKPQESINISEMAETWRIKKEEEVREVLPLVETQQIRVGVNPHIYRDPHIDHPLEEIVKELESSGESNYKLNHYKQAIKLKEAIRSWENNREENNVPGVIESFYTLFRAANLYSFAKNNYKTDVYCAESIFDLLKDFSLENYIKDFEKWFEELDGVEKEKCQKHIKEGLFYRLDRGSNYTNVEREWFLENENCLAYLLTFIGEITDDEEKKKPCSVGMSYLDVHSMFNNSYSGGNKTYDEFVNEIARITRRVDIHLEVNKSIAGMLINNLLEGLQGKKIENQTVLKAAETLKILCSGKTLKDLIEDKILFASDREIISLYEAGLTYDLLEVKDGKIRFSETVSKNNKNLKKVAHSLLCDSQKGSQESLKTMKERNLFSYAIKEKNGICFIEDGEIENEVKEKLFLYSQNRHFMSGFYNFDIFPNLKFDEKNLSDRGLKRNVMQEFMAITGSNSFILDEKVFHEETRTSSPHLIIYCSYYLLDEENKGGAGRREADYIRFSRNYLSITDLKIKEPEQYEYDEFVDKIELKELPVSFIKEQVAKNKDLSDCIERLGFPYKDENGERDACIADLFRTKPEVAKQVADRFFTNIEKFKPTMFACFNMPADIKPATDLFNHLIAFDDAGLLLRLKKELEEIYEKGINPELEENQRNVLSSIFSEKDEYNDFKYGLSKCTNGDVRILSILLTDKDLNFYYVKNNLSPQKIRKNKEDYEQKEKNKEISPYGLTLVNSEKFTIRESLLQEKYRDLSKQDEELLFPLGEMVHIRKLSNQLDKTVNPRLHPLFKSNQHRFLSQIDRDYNTPSTSGEFQELRDYVPGDSLSRVDWKATGRRGNGKPVIKEFKEDTRRNSYSYVVNLDWISSGKPLYRSSKVTENLKLIMHILFSGVQENINQEVFFEENGIVIAKIDSEGLEQAFSSKPISDEYGERTYKEDFIEKVLALSMKSRNSLGEPVFDSNFNKGIEVKGSTVVVASSIEQISKSSTAIGMWKSQKKAVMRLDV